MSGTAPMTTAPKTIVGAANTTNKLTPEMQQQLEQLRDIHLPEPVSWFPMAIGWWILIALIIIALIFIYRNIAAHRRIYKHPAYLSAVDELAHLPANANGDSAKLAGDLSTLLKRVGLFHNLPIATLSGDDWANYLMQTHMDGAKNSIKFDQAQADFIANGAYANDTNTADKAITNNTTVKEVPEWQNLEATARSWITVQFEQAANPKKASKASNVTKPQVSSRKTIETTAQEAIKQNKETL